MSATQANPAEFQDAGKPLANPFYQVDTFGNPIGNKTLPIAAAGSANVKANPGFLVRVLITTAGTAALTFYDNAAGAALGTVIGVTPATTSVGQMYEFQMPALIGISAVGGAGSPGVTVSYS